MTQQIPGPGAGKPRRAFILSMLVIVAALAALGIYQFWRQSREISEPRPQIVTTVLDTGEITPPLTSEAPPQDEAPPPEEPVTAPPPDEAASTPPPEEPLTAPPPEMAAQLGQMTQALTAVSSRLEGFAHDIAALNARMVALEAAGAPGGTLAQPQISWLLALRDLERALAGPGPFEIELQALGKLTGIAADDPGIAGLQKFASAGIPAMAQLAQRFAPVATAIVGADAGAGQAGWAGLWRGWSSALLTIRPVGERQGNTVPDIVARAETRLAEGDLEAAVRETETLRGAAAAAAAEWLAAARARLRAGRELAGLNARFALSLDLDPVRMNHPDR